MTLEEKLTIRPPSRRRRAASRSVLNVPFRLTAIWRSNSVVAAIRDRRQVHDPGIVDQHVDAAERGFGRVEHARHSGDIRDVGLGGDGPAAGRLDPGDHRLRRGGVAGVVHHHGEAVLGEALGDRGADAAGGAGDDGDFVGLGGHDLSPRCLRAGDRRLTRARCIFPTGG